MRCAFRGFAFLALSLICFVVGASAQVGNSGSIEGVVKDSSGAAVVNVAVEIKDPVSGYERTTTTSNEGAFRFTNVPFNGYHLSVNATDLLRSHRTWRCGQWCQRKSKST